VHCADFVRAVVNMRGIMGYFSFFQTSPFDLTRITVNLTNLNQVGPYHVHQFPVPNSIGSGLCSNANVGGHWNPFGIDTMSQSYPKGPGSTHDKYEIGDLSTKHESLKDKSMIMKTFTDFNLPLFGQNSIVGRSVVIHSQTDNARFACASIAQPSIRLQDSGPCRVTMETAVSVSCPPESPQ
uniref:Superoxide dismutase copper/zinc binding domain-containing protein n=1 Tax=Oryzias latipes TaxID=8090 RepID=A0A3P9JLK0_ORYLA